MPGWSREYVRTSFGNNSEHLFDYNRGMGRYLVDWDAVQDYYDQGHGRDECRAKFGFRLDAWYKAIRRGALRARPQRKTINWDAVQRYYDEGHTYRECRTKFDFAALSWTKAVRRGALRARARAKPIPLLLATSKSRVAIKRRLLDAGILQIGAIFAASPSGGVDRSAFKSITSTASATIIG